MVSHQHQCIFVHIPKVAGTSIIDTLADRDGAGNAIEDLCPSSSYHPHFNPPPPHLAIGHYLDYGLVTQQQFNDYFKFSFVRNPWDRLVSEYKYRRHPQRYAFKDFLFHHFPQPEWTDEYCHVIPQYHFLFDGHGRQMVDFVGKYERLTDDFDHVCQVLSVAQKRLPHKNKSDSFFRRDNDLVEMLRTLRSDLSRRRKRNSFKHYTQYYDDECIAFVNNLYRKDIETFHYRFGDE